MLVACVTLLIVSETLAEDPETVLFSGLLGLVVYLAVNGLGTLFENPERGARSRRTSTTTRTRRPAAQPRAASPSWPGRPARPASSCSSTSRFSTRRSPSTA